jgi:hypothetical protein
MTTKSKLGETASITNRLRRKRGPVMTIDPAKWDQKIYEFYREKAYRKLGEDMVRKNPAPNEIERRMAAVHRLIFGGKNG